MSQLGYEIRYHPELAWWDGRYRVYFVDQSGSTLAAGALTRWGARRIIAGFQAREKATQTYTVVEAGTLPFPTEEGT